MLPGLPVKMWVEHRRYEILFASFLLLIFGNTFSFGRSVLIDRFFVVKNMLVGLVVFYRNKNLRIAFICLNVLHFAIELLSNRAFHFDSQSWKGIIYLLYFGLVSVEVYRKIFQTKHVSHEMIAAVLCGFVLLCLIGTFLFNQIEIAHSGSFSNISQGRSKINDLNYFSFITVLTIGYGDILPLTMVAKRAVMLMGLAGHFYTVFVTGIVIGKYLNNRKGG